MTGVQTCALPIFDKYGVLIEGLNSLPAVNDVIYITINTESHYFIVDSIIMATEANFISALISFVNNDFSAASAFDYYEIGRASCRERV